MLSYYGHRKNFFSDTTIFGLKDNSFIEVDHWVAYIVRNRHKHSSTLELLESYNINTKIHNGPILKHHELKEILLEIDESFTLNNNSNKDYKKIFNFFTLHDFLSILTKNWFIIFIFNILIILVRTYRLNRLLFLFSFLMIFLIPTNQ